MEKPPVTSRTSASRARTSGSWRKRAFPIFRGIGVRDTRDLTLGDWKRRGGRGALPVPGRPRGRQGHVRRRGAVGRGAQPREAHVRRVLPGHRGPRHDRGVARRRGARSRSSSGSRARCSWCRSTPTTGSSMRRQPGPAAGREQRARRLEHLPEPPLHLRERTISASATTCRRRLLQAEDGPRGGVGARPGRDPQQRLSRTSSTASCRWTTSAPRAIDASSRTFTASSRDCRHRWLHRPVPERPLLKGALPPSRARCWCACAARATRSTGRSSSGPQPWQDGKGDQVQVQEYMAGGLVAAAPGGGNWFHQHFSVGQGADARDQLLGRPHVKWRSNGQRGWRGNPRLERVWHRRRRT